MSDVSVTLYLNIKCLYIFLHFDVNRIIKENLMVAQYYEYIKDCSVNHLDFIVKSILLLGRVLIITHRLKLNNSIQELTWCKFKLSPRAAKVILTESIPSNKILAVISLKKLVKMSIKCRVAESY